MRYIFFIALILFGWASPVLGQRIEWSQPQKIERRANITEVIGQNDGGIYVLKKSYRDEQRDIIIERYSESLKRTAMRNYLTSKYDYYAQLVVHKEGLHLFFANYNKDTKEYVLKVKRLDENLTQIGNDTALFAIPANPVNERFLQVFKLKNSHDVLFTFTRQGNDIPSYLNYLLVDSTLHKVAEGAFNINVEQSYNIVDAAFTRQNLVLLVKEEVKKKVNKQGFHFHLFDAAFGQNDLRDTKLYDDTLSVTEGVMKVDFANKAIVFAGIYGNNDSTYSKGYYLWRQKLQDGSAFMEIMPFSKQIIDEMSGKVSKIEGVNNLRVGDIVLRHDGGVVLTCEEFQETRELVFDMNMGNTVPQSNFRYYYYYNNLLVLSVDTAARLDWHTVVRKDQISINDQGIYSSYLMTVSGNKLYYVYNDLSRKNWSLNYYAVSENGVSNGNVMIKSQDYDGRLIPQQGKQISYNSLLIPGYNRNGLVLMKVSF